MKKPRLLYRIVVFPSDGRVQILRFDDVTIRDRTMTHLEAAGTPAFSCTIDWISHGADEIGYHREK